MRLRAFVCTYSGACARARVCVCAGVCVPHWRIEARHATQRSSCHLRAHTRLRLNPRSATGPIPLRPIQLKVALVFVRCAPARTRPPRHPRPLPAGPGADAAAASAAPVQMGGGASPLCVQNVGGRSPSAGAAGESPVPVQPLVARDRHASRHAIRYSSRYQCLIGVRRVLCTARLCYHAIPPRARRDNKRQPACTMRNARCSAARKVERMPCNRQHVTSIVERH